jgi:hypothetical protein
VKVIYSGFVDDIEAQALVNRDVILGFCVEAETA